MVMVDRSLVQALQAARDVPSVSVLVPVGDGPEGRVQGPTRLKNLVRSAADRLAAERPGRDTDLALERLGALADQVDFWREARGLALFASPRVGLQVDLPITVRERVVIDETFATRDLVRAVARSIRHRVVVLGEATVRLLEGERDRLVEVTTAGFPVAREPLEPGERPYPFDRALRERRRGRDEQVLRLFRRAAEALARLEEREPLPLSLVGVERQLARFEPLLRRGFAVAGRCVGNHEASAPQRLGPVVWPAVADRIEAARQAVALDVISFAAKAERLATGLVESWHMAHEGRGAHLVVEEGFHAAARPGPAPGLIQLDAPRGWPGRIDDAVDELVEAVQLRSGRVTFVPDGALEAHGRVALAMRY